MTNYLVSYTNKTTGEAEIEEVKAFDPWLAKQKIFREGNASEIEAVEA